MYSLDNKLVNIFTQYTVHGKYLAGESLANHTGKSYCKEKFGK